jgi:two-component system, sensor histidine kinase PdtaS
MERAKDRPRAAWYIAAVGLVVALLATAWLGVGSVAQRSYLAMAVRARELEASIAARAMEESFTVTMDQSSIIASFSFAEYFAGKRSEASMGTLLDRQRLALPGMIADAYIDALGIARFESIAPGAMAARRALLEGNAVARAALKSSRGPYVLASGVPGPFFVYYHPVRQGDRLQGLLGAAIDLMPAIHKYLSPLTERPGRSVYLLGDADSILWSSLPGLADRRFGGEGKRADAESRQSFLLGNCGFSIVVVDDEAAIRINLQPAERLRNMVVLAGAMLIVAAMWAALRLYLSETRRRGLAETEARLSSAIKAREKELAESELRFERLFDAASDAILILDRSNSVLRCNRRAATAFGCAPEELIGKVPEELVPAIREDGEAGAQAAEDLMRRARRDSSVSCELTLRRLDGSEFLAEAGIAVVDSGGEQYTQVILRDITERRRQMLLLQESLEEREILLRELHHRVKNNLQIIISIIALQRANASREADAALQKTGDRVEALAAAYLAAADRPESLVIDIAAYLRTICDLVRDQAAAAGTRLSIDLLCEDLDIGLNAAVNLGLLVRELAENSAAHGYGPGAAGRLELRFVREEGSAVLELRDYGVGLPLDYAEGLGLSLARAFASQISGELLLRSMDKGTLASLRFPLS